MPRRSRKSHIRTDGTRYGRKKQVAGDSLAYLGRNGVQVTGTLGDSALENKLKQQWQQTQVLKQLQPGSIEQLGQQASQVGMLSGGSWLQWPSTYNNTERGWTGDPVSKTVDKAMKLPCVESGVRKITFEEEEK